MQNKMTVDRAIEILKDSSTLWEHVLDYDEVEAVKTLISHSQKQECVGVGEIKDTIESYGIDMGNSIDISFKQLDELCESIASLGITKKPSLDDLQVIIHSKSDLTRRTSFEIAQDIIDKFFK